MRTLPSLNLSSKQLTIIEVSQRCLLLFTGVLALARWCCSCWGVKLDVLSDLLGWLRPLLDSGPPVELLGVRFCCCCWSLCCGVSGAPLRLSAAALDEDEAVADCGIWPGPSCYLITQRIIRKFLQPSDFF